FSTKYLFAKYHESKDISIQCTYFSAIIHILNDKKFRIILILFPELNEFINFIHKDSIHFENLSLIFSLFTVLIYRFEFLAPIIKTEIESSLKKGSLKCYSDCKFLFYIVLQTRFFINLVAVNSLLPQVPCKASVILTFVSYCAYFYPYILENQKTNETYIQYFLLNYRKEAIYSKLFKRVNIDSDYYYTLIQKSKIYCYLGRDLNLTSDELKKFVDSSSLQLTFEDVKNNIKEAINNAVLNEILQYYDIPRLS
ncbi:hypothetical protein TUBRATIS_001510, partial [Tubulinosema ratisbonensis]